MRNVIRAFEDPRTCLHTFFLEVVRTYNTIHEFQSSPRNEKKTYRRLLRLHLQRESVSLDVGRK